MRHRLCMSPTPPAATPFLGCTRAMVGAACILLLTVGSAAPRAARAAEPASTHTAEATAARNAGASPAAPRESAASRHAQAIPVERLFRTALAKEGEGEDGAAEALAIYRATLRNGATGEVAEEAWLGVARCELLLGNPWRAFLAVEQSFPSHYDARRVSERITLQIEIAKALEAQGMTPVDMGEGEEKKSTGYEAASRIYERIVYNDPQHPFAPEALLRAGDCHRKIGNYDQAEFRYRQLLTHYEHAEAVGLARPSLAEVLARRHRATNPDAVRSEVADLLPPEELEVEMSEAVRERTQAAHAVRNETEAESMYEKARYYAGTGRRGRSAAIFLCEDILKRFPGTPSAVEAQTLLETLNARNGRPQ